MKSLAWRLSLMAALAALTWSGRVAVSAAEADQGGPGDRIERLERRVNEMAQRQEQLLRRLGAQQERQGPAAMPGGEGLRQPGPQSSPCRQRQRLSRHPMSARRSATS